MPREVLGGLVGRSASWVKALETGRLKEPRLPVLFQLAEALRVRDLADLTGHANQHVDLFTGPGHRYLPAVRAAIDSLVVTTDRQAPPVEHLRARLDHAWAARHASPYHREVLGELLPGLIGDAQAAGAGHSAGVVAVGFRARPYLPCGCAVVPGRLEGSLGAVPHHSTWWGLLVSAGGVGCWRRREKFSNPPLDASGLGS